MPPIFLQNSLLLESCDIFITFPFTIWLSFLPPYCWMFCVWLLIVFSKKMFFYCIFMFSSPLLFLSLPRLHDRFIIFFKIFIQKTKFHLFLIDFFVIPPFNSALYSYWFSDILPFNSALYNQRFTTSSTINFVSNLIW